MPRTREQLAETESERSRYQQAIQFVTHEMRTPLSAIQGSNFVITRGFTSGCVAR